MARVKMLLVEDDAAIAELVTWHFKREDYEVKHTPDGEEALLLAKEVARHETHMKELQAKSVAASVSAASGAGTTAPAAAPAGEENK